MHTEADAANDQPEPAPRKRDATSNAGSGKPTPAEGPFGKLRRWFGS